MRGILDKHGLDKYDFDGCAVGIVNADGIPLKKPWSVATNVKLLGNTLSKFKCRCTSPHAQGRGQSLKDTENYTFKFIDAIHAAFSLSVTSRVLSVTIAVKMSSLAPSVDILLNDVLEKELDIQQTKWDKLMKQFQTQAAIATIPEPDTVTRTIASQEQAPGVMLGGNPSREQLRNGLLGLEPSPRAECPSGVSRFAMPLGRGGRYLGYRRLIVCDG